ncbi:HAD-IIIA family hydrolase [Gluconobacter sp. LMG 31484]|uniref:D,D-heptose 1,7-bisphosphate phosphatase n=1 Tax=Gluconobacter vitians TaxID=2728102 RepID=A0ABR9Y482_9PROT|nr:HAD-IIIA family hydrolase [Gluconobacter vitians]MBF0858521.1 HAD-IIIA family hydrolase [Gluconobacter vitians]
MSGVTVRQCAILVGGLGTRLGALTQSLPKPLMTCGDRPFLAWLMREMQRFGVEEFVLLAGHLSHEIERAVEQIRLFLPKPAKITISVEPFRAGTGGALYHAREHLQERFLLCNGDSIFSCNLSRFLSRARSGNWMLLREVDDLDRYGEVRLESDGECVASFHPKAEQAGRSGLINSGIYLFDHSVFDHLTPNCSLEQDVLPKLAQEKALRGVCLTGYFRDIGLPDDLVAAGQELPEVLLRPAVFLDRDGVINRDHGWVGTRERFEWEDGVLSAIARMTDSGHHVFVVTNQSGIARGFYSEADLTQLMDWVIETVREHGGTIEDWRYCPIHPDAKLPQYRGHSPDRKPEPGMILDLLKRWEIKPEHCVLYGDQPSDMQAASAAGIRGILVGPASLAELISKTKDFP